MPKRPYKHDPAHPMEHLCYTVGAKRTYDKKSATHKAVGGSVWSIYAQALAFRDNVTIDGTPVEGGIYVLLLPASLEKCSVPTHGTWRELTVPAKILGEITQSLPP